MDVCSEVSFFLTHRVVSRGCDFIVRSLSLKICARSVERVVRSITSRYVASIDLKIYATLLKLIKLLV
jgi:hypothetical protein